MKRITIALALGLIFQLYAFAQETLDDYDVIEEVTSDRVINVAPAQSVLYDISEPAELTLDDGYEFDAAGGNLLMVGYNVQQGFIPMEIESFGSVWWGTDNCEQTNYYVAGEVYPNFNVERYGNNLAVHFSYSVAWEVDESILPSWVTLNNTLKNANEMWGSVEVMLDENSNDNERAGYISLKSVYNDSEERIYITQGGPTISNVIVTGHDRIEQLNSGEDVYILSHEPGEVDLDVTAETEELEWTIKFSGDTDWLLSPSELGTGSQAKIIHHYYDKGSNGLVTAHIYIGNKLIRTVYFRKESGIRANTFSEKNFLLTRTYEGAANFTGQIIKYTDFHGKPTQSLTLNMNDRKVVASEILYDEFNRPEITTLPIPTDVTTFEFIDDFVNRNTSNLDYVARESTTQAGKYYSHNNSDQYVPADTRPFTFTEYSNTIPGAIKNSYAPGVALEGLSSYSYKVTASPYEIVNLSLSNKVNIKTLEAGTTVMDDFEGITKTVSRDVMGKEAITYYDSDGNSIISCISGDEVLPAQRRMAYYRIHTNNGGYGYIDIHLPNNLADGELYQITKLGNWQHKVVNLITESEDSGTNTENINDKSDGFYRVYCSGVEHGHTAYVGFEMAYKYHSFSAYDLAGRKVRSLSPEHASRLSAMYPVNSSTVDDYTNRYTYNTLGWLIESYSPDVDTTQYLYCKDGRIRFSQNKKQHMTNKYSYTNYDKHKRVIESGECSEVYILSFADCKNQSDIDGIVVPQPYCSQQTYTWYDDPDDECIRDQKFTEGRVAMTQNATTSTWYSYNYDGSVEWAIQEIEGFDLDGDGITNTPSTAAIDDPDDLITLDYTYNFNGSINDVAYQLGKVDELIHKYFYDLNNRLCAVYTKEASNEEYALQARYEYYLHGPLKRIELGGDLQGVDYVYNINGLLKSINNPVGTDPGGDGDAQNPSFGTDLFAMGLDYYQDDYVRDDNDISSNPTTNFFDGKIAQQYWINNTLANVGEHAELAYRYSYDERNYLGKAVLGNLVSGSFISDNSYNVQGPLTNNFIEYDANGNIKSLIRYGSDEGVLDNMSYTYNGSSEHLNQLARVTDGGQVNNYSYNAVGQLTEDSYGKNGAGHRFTYDVHGKVTTIDNVAGNPIADYYYDDRGFRVRKVDYNNSQTTWYTRDINGNIMATYITDDVGTNLLEQPIYGSGRIGLKNSKNDYAYELIDHLGNVRVTFSRDGDNNNVQPDVLTATDYYPFGMSMPGRIFGTGYRFGYQGQFAEKDEEIGYNQFALRLYNARTGRWMIPDPANQFYCPYLAMSNNWPNVVDLEGDVAWFVPGIVGGVVAIGFNINAQIQDGSFDLASGKTWARMGVAGGTGFGLAYTPGGWAGIVTAGLASGTSNFVDQAIKNGGFNDIDKSDVLANTIGGVVGHSAGNMIGRQLKPGTWGGSMLIRRFDLNMRDAAVKAAVRNTTEALGSLAGGYSSVELSHMYNSFDYAVTGTTPWGHNYTTRPGVPVELPPVYVYPE